MPLPRSFSWPARHLLWSCFAFALLLVSPALAQTPSPTPSTSLSLSLTTSSTTVTTTIHTDNRDVTTTTVIPTVFNVTLTVTQTRSSAAPDATTSAPPDFTKLDTHIDPGFGVLGAVLILTGLPSAFLGHKNRWTSFFLVGFYTLSLVCFVLILRFGVIQAVNPPNRTLRGLFVLSSGVAGIAGGGIAIFFWKAAKYFIGAWGGFALALWIQCFRDGGLIGPLGYRWIMYIAISVVGFVLCTLPKLHYYTLLTSTAFVGATAFILGVDCYTTAGLKEFYVWNIGFDALFTKYQQHGIKFPVTQIMQIELGMMGAVSIMGIAVQFQIMKILMRKMREIEAERKRQDQAAEIRAAERFKDLDVEKDEWELRHPSMLKHGRADSNLSGTPLLGKDGSPTIDLDSPHGTPRQRYQSGLSEFMAAPTPADELNRVAHKQLQTPGALPVLDLGDDIETNVPDTFITKKAESDGSRTTTKSAALGDPENMKRREELLSEIQTIRRSIELLRGETPVPSTSDDSRHPSVGSRPISQDLSSLSVAPAAHLRPPRQRDPRGRVQSMGLSDLSQVSSSEAGASIGRPTSAPLRNDAWDSYLLERKLLQPPSGVTAPIPTTPISPPKVSPAVVVALKERQRLESALSGHQLEPESKRSSSEDLPLALRPQHKKSVSQGGTVPVIILPPQRIVEPQPMKAPSQGLVVPFEELEARHRKQLRQMQDPITQAEKEHHDISEARGRWDRAKEAERRQMARKESERAQTQKEKAKERKPSGGATSGGAESPEGRKHRRSLSADVLANIPGAQASSRRMSTMKVEDWQRGQVDVEDEQARPAHARKGSSSMTRRQSGVPFPESPRDRSTRKTSTTLPRDPVS